MAGKFDIIYCNTNAVMYNLPTFNLTRLTPNFITQESI